MAWMRACTCSLAPSPTPTIAITAPTPMMMPSMVAMRALTRNKMRSVLTMLGIIIGVGARMATFTIETKAMANYIALGAVAAVRNSCPQWIMALEFTASCLQDSLSLFRYYKQLGERAM